MILYYAVGGGLGHLVRARAVLHTLGLSSDAAVVTASAFADDARVVGDVPVLRVPAALDRDRGATRRWVTDLLAGERPDGLFVDAFPGGVLGELCGLVWDGPVHHVARLLRWERYARRLDGPLPRFATTYVVEPLHAEHEAALAAASDAVAPLTLVDPPASAPALDLGGATLVVHSGPDAEVDALVALARNVEPSGDRIVVAAPRRPPGDAEWVDVHPAAALFPTAGAIVTAAGFNAMRQAEPFRERHAFVAFPRPLDDQPARARAAA